MITHRITSIWALAGAMILAACANTEQKQLARECDDSITSGVELLGKTPATAQDLRAIIAGTPANVALGSAQKLEDTIDRLGGAGPNLRAKIESLRNGPLKDGLAGVPADLFFDAATGTLAGDDFGHPVEMNTKGRLEAYYYNDGAGWGCLKVLMATTMTTPTGNAVISRKLRWTVFVNRVTDDSGLEIRGFNVATKIPTTSPQYNANDVFLTGPGTAADTVALNAKMATGFEYKLWAKGLSIEVTKVEEEIGAGGFHTLPPAHPLYNMNAASCVDMMFAAYPPMTLPQGSGPPFYCLGRCQDPYIVNTK